MKWVSSVSDHSNLVQAVAETSRSIKQQLQGEAPDLVIVFISGHHEDSYARVPLLLHSLVQESLVIGCSAGGVIGGGEEVEGRPGFSLTAAVLPGVELMPIRVENALIPNEEASQEEWELLMHVKPSENPHFILLPDPFSFKAEKFLKNLDHAFPASKKLGGLVSGGSGPGENALFLGRRVYRRGLVGVALSGNIEIDTLVSQGCRPIGAPMFVTRCEGNLLQELDGNPPVDVLRDLYNDLDEKDRELFSDSLSLGIVMKSSEQQYKKGDFLIRNIIGMEVDSECLLVGTQLKENSVVQLHLRDAQTSSEDLNYHLTSYLSKVTASKPEGSLVFSCMGRGEELYGQPNHEMNMIKKYFGPLAVGGFFCNGEIGQVEGDTFLHGYTSSVALFRSREK